MRKRLLHHPAILRSYRSEIERSLEELLPCDARLKSQVHLRNAIRYAVLSGGARIRPILVLASCASLGGLPKDALPLACAVEMVHASSLVFDDLPIMDNEDERRSGPTLHRKESDALAILAAISLLARAFEMAGEYDAAHGSSTTACLAKTVGEAGMCGGQLMDLGLDSHGGLELRSAETMERLCIGKTGLLMATACEMGAIVAKAGPSERRALHDYGLKLGVAYQIVDDLSDQVSDASKGRPNYATLVGSQQASERVTALLEAATLQSKALGIDTSFLDAYAQTLVVALRPVPKIDTDGGALNAL